MESQDIICWYIAYSLLGWTLDVLSILVYTNVFRCHHFGQQNYHSHSFTIGSPFKYCQKLPSLFLMLIFIEMEPFWKFYHFNLNRQLPFKIFHKLLLIVYKMQTLRLSRLQNRLHASMLQTFVLYICTCLKLQQNPQCNCRIPTVTAESTVTVSISQTLLISRNSFSTYLLQFCCRSIHLISEQFQLIHFSSQLMGRRCFCLHNNTNIILCFL